MRPSVRNLEPVAEFALSDGPIGGFACRDRERAKNQKKRKTKNAHTRS
jgi:hypothetical protein